MKKLVLALAVSMMSVTAFAKTVEITGEKAEALFFEMEKSGATMTIHTPRLTEYNSKNVTCVAEERYTEDGERTGVADFTCLIDITK